MLWHLGRSTSVVSQILLDEFMRDGHLSHHLLNMNKIYSERYHKLTQLIDNVDCLQRIRLLTTYSKPRWIAYSS